MLGIWVSFLLQSLFSIDQLGLTVWGWVISGLVIGASYASPTVTASKAKRRGAKQQANSSAAVGAVGAIVLAMLGAMFAAGPLGTDSRLAVAASYQVDTTQPAQVAAVKQAVLAATEGVEDPYFAAQLVTKLYQSGSVDDGIKYAEESVVKFPLDVNLWNLIALAYEQTGRAALAVPARTKTIELDPLNDEYKTLLEQDKAAK